jgi:hypothetical protein
MVNKFEKRKITTHFFDSISNLKNDLLFYLYDNLYHENIDTLTRDLEIALTNYANGEYI